LGIGRPLEVDAAGALAEFAGLEIESNGEKGRAAEIAREPETADEIAEEILLMLRGVEDESLGGADLLGEGG